MPENKKQQKQQHYISMIVPCFSPDLMQFDPCFLAFTQKLDDS